MMVREVHLKGDLKNRNLSAMGISKGKTFLSSQTQKWEYI